MKCEVLLFAQLREAIGSERLSLELPHGATVGDALDLLAKQHRAVTAMRKTIAVAVDQKYRPLNAVLDNGCTIALIPPVSGG